MINKWREYYVVSKIIRGFQISETDEHTDGGVCLQPQRAGHLPGASALKTADTDRRRTSLLYDMKKFREAADVIVEIPSLNPEFDAKCAALKTMIMDAF